MQALNLNHEHQNLFEFAGIFMGELSRIFKLKQQDKDLYPPLTTGPVLLDAITSSFRAISPESPLDITPVWDYYVDLLGDPDPANDNDGKRQFDTRRIVQHFTPGIDHYLGFFPFDEGGLPLSKSAKSSPSLLKRLTADESGLTTGFTQTEAYYLPLFPPEYLQAAKVEVPAFNESGPTKAQIDQLRQNFFRALSATESLLGLTHQDTKNSDKPV